MNKLSSIELALEFYRDFLSDARKYGEAQSKAAMRELALRDLFFLLYHLLNRKDINRPWLYEKVREVEDSPNGNLDLWAREHYKTTIITFGLTIQDILFDPEITIGIFSFNRPTAKAFLRSIKWEMESNQALKSLFDDILWAVPEKESPKWSEDDGLIVKRTSNPKEATVEAWGLIEAMPTAKHYKVRVYDDIITERQVTNPEMIQKVTQAWELSLNLGSQQSSTRYGVANIQRYCGTRYHFNDPYREIVARGIVKERKHPGTLDGKVDGEPVLWSREVIAEKRKEMGPYTFGCQVLLNPVADEAQGFKEEWLSYWKRDSWEGWNLYLLCDPAGEKKKTNDYTVMVVIGLAPDKNYYLIDGIRDRLNLTERTNQLFKFHREYHPLKTGYEKYGKDSDIEHIEFMMQTENYRFHITELGGQTPKNDRIRKLVPIFEQKRFYLPTKLMFIDKENKQKDLIKLFIDEEYSVFPVAWHDDMLDCMARIIHEELKAVFPGAPTRIAMKDPDYSIKYGADGWML